MIDCCRSCGSLAFEFVQVELLVVLGVLASQDLLFQLAEMFISLFVFSQHSESVYDQALMSNPHHAVFAEIKYYFLLCLMQLIKKERGLPS